jgi:hypothetical protein
MFVEHQSTSDAKIRTEESCARAVLLNLLINNFTD